MRILIITNHFWPEEFRVNDLALALKRRGHELTVFTGIPDYPCGRFYSGYGFFKKRVEYYEGVRIVHFPLIPRWKGRAWNMVLHYLSSTIMSCVLAPFYFRKRLDLIIVFETSPVTIGLPAVLLKKLKSIPILFWVLDLWPESLTATGAVRSPLVLHMVEKLVRFIYRNSDRILVSSKSFIRSIASLRGYEGGIEYFPNWVEPSYLERTASNCQAGMPILPIGFRIMFAGNIGAAQDFETLLSAAELLKGHSDIKWIILGDGRRMAWVHEQLAARDLQGNVHLLGRFPSDSMPHFFDQADVMLVTLRKEKIFELTVPGKIQSYMASGKPIIAALDGEGANLIRESGSGISCPAGSPDSLAQAVLSMYQMPEEARREMGLRGRTYCLKYFERDSLIQKLELWMNEVNQGHAEVVKKSHVEINQ